MKFFEADVVTLVLRLYLMMAVVIGAFVSGLYFLAILALPIFLSVMTGVKIELFKKEKKTHMKLAKKLEVNTNTKLAA